MQDTQLTRISNFLWSVSDDLLRDLYVRGKYRDVILPMTVLRRLDAVLEPSKQKVLDEKKFLDNAGITDQKSVLQDVAQHAFYNTSPFTMRNLAARAAQQSLRADFEMYLNGYSDNVQEILKNFEFRNQLNRLSQSDVLGALIARFLSPDINLSPYPVKNDGGTVKLPGLDNHSMGTIFEDLVRRFNEENNEEAGEHWTPRDAVELMAQLVFQPVADQIQSGTYLLYDGAIGTGGMLTIADQTLHDIAALREQQVSTHLYGQEINSETYAICKADLLLKDDKDADSNIVGGPQHSTLSNDAFGNHTFDFMLSNPPYGKSWKTDLDRMGGKSGMTDTRFVIQHDDDPEYSLITRVNDGQMMFLANMLSKMKHDTPLGSRIAEVHNGSSLFTGDAGQGESNTRRWIIENDWLEAIVALPLNMFYNTGIATYVWVITNRKAAHRQGYIQLIDTTKWFTPLRRNLGQKNCELAEDDIDRTTQAFMAFEETEQSKIFQNAAFGYWKVTVERPLRLTVELTPERRNEFRQACHDAKDQVLADIADRVAAGIGVGPHNDFNLFLEAFRDGATSHGAKLTAKRTALLKNVLAYRDETAEPVIKTVHRGDTAESNPINGRYPTMSNGETTVVEYEPDPDLRDTEQIPLLEDGGIEAFLRREVLPHAEDAWYNPASVKIGYEINFNRHFYKPPTMRSLDEIRADIVALERETGGLLAEVMGVLST